MGRPTDIHHLFNGLVFSATPDKILPAVERKIAELTSKITERKGRIAKIREEHEITDGDLILLLQIVARQSTEAFYTLVSNVHRAPLGQEARSQEVERVIPAGIVKNLMAEQEMIDSETELCRRLGIVRRNLPEGKDQTLSFYDLEFLGL